MQVIGPDAELESIGESYAIYIRKFALNFMPHAGLVFSLGSNLNQDNMRVEEFNRLFQSVSFKPAYLLVKDVIVEVDINDNTQIRVRTEDVIEDTLTGFKNLEKMLLDFYGFARIV